MSRTSRAVAIGYPHHVTQRGNNRQTVFIDDQDRLTYLDLLKQYAVKFKLDIWAYCLMSNHVHLLVIPRAEDALSCGVGLANQVYTRYVNRKYFRSGRLWQNRFFSCVVDKDEYLWCLARYIENNPVKAGLSDAAENYRWSSAKHHLEGEPDLVLSRPDWLDESSREDHSKFLIGDDAKTIDMINQATRSGRPLCSSETLLKLERLLDRSWRALKKECPY